MPDASGTPVARRLPQTRAPARIEPLATLPVFFKLHGHRVVVAGGSEAAAWKAELVAAAGARTEVFAAEPCEALLALADGGVISLHRRDWGPADLDGAVICVGSFATREDATRFAAASRRAGAACNVVDRPELCTFQLGAIVNRSPVVVAVSTDGGAPMLGQAIRSDIEALLPAGLGRWATAAKHWRALLRDRLGDFAARRRFWERFTALARTETGRAPCEADLDALLAADPPSGRSRSAGKVLLVGAGPGDPELLTLAALRALRSADTILYDDLAAPAVLDLARREAARILVGKRGGGPSCAQGDINALMVSLAGAGQRVVRLKSGDPLIFGRAREETDALAAAGIPFEIVPGISAAQGAAARLGASLTERDVASRLQIVTGHGRGGGLPDDIDWRALADRHATTAVYMPKGTLRGMCDAIVAAGAEPTRTAVAVFEATRADELVVRGTLADLAGKLEALRRQGPCVVVVGEALREAASPDAGAATAQSAPVLAAAE